MVRMSDAEPYHHDRPSKRRRIQPISPEEEEDEKAFMSNWSGDGHSTASTVILSSDASPLLHGDRSSSTRPAPTIIDLTNESSTVEFYADENSDDAKRREVLSDTPTSSTAVIMPMVQPSKTTTLAYHQRLAFYHPTLFDAYQSTSRIIHTLQ